MQLVDLHPTYVNKYVRRGESRDHHPGEPSEKTVPTDGIWRGERSHRPGLGLISILPLTCYGTLAAMLRFRNVTETLWLRTCIAAAKRGFQSILHLTLKLRVMAGSEGLAEMLKC